MADFVWVCEVCATSSDDDDTVQLRECGHVLCEEHTMDCEVCLREEADRTMGGRDGSPRRTTRSQDGSD